jgi:hypothetical protein
LSGANLSPLYLPIIIAARCSPLARARITSASAPMFRRRDDPFLPGFEPHGIARLDGPAAANQEN